MGQELSMTEKRVLLALDKLKGAGTPEMVQEAMLPDAIAELSRILKESLELAFADTDITVGDNQRARLIEDLLTNCVSDDDKEMETCIVTTLTGLAP